LSMRVLQVALGLGVNGAGNPPPPPNIRGSGDKADAMIRAALLCARSVQEPTMFQTRLGTTALPLEPARSTS